MDPTGGFVTGSLISAGASLLGGILGSNDASAQRKMQNHYNKNRIQMTVADARKAGVHPLYALGAAGTGTAPTPIRDPLGDAVAQGGKALAQIKLRGVEGKLQEKALEQAEENLYLTRAQANKTQAETNAIELMARDSENARLKQTAQTTVEGTKLNNLTGSVTVGKSDGAQAYEDQYGGMVADVAGIFNWLEDTGYAKKTIDAVKQLPSYKQIAWIAEQIEKFQSTDQVKK